MLDRRWLGCAIALCLASAGCSAIINPDEGRFGDGQDAGSNGMDAGGDVDAGGGVDAGSVDAGQTECESLDPICRGDGLVTCVSGFEQVQSCQAQDSFCEDGECRDWECEPSSRECNGDLSAVIQCDARGTGSNEIECPTGVCNEATGNCEGVGPDRCRDLPSIAIGSTQRLNLCEHMDVNTFTDEDECDDSFRAQSGDRGYRLEVPRDMDLVIELEDEDLLRPVDVVLYVRRVCDNPGTQVACDRHTPCEGVILPGTCRGGRNDFEARIRTSLSAGTYYIFADAFVYNSGDGRRSECGTVELRVRPAG